MRRSLLLADIDGTLVDETGTLWPEALAVVDSAASSNRTVALCSARPEWSVRSLAEHLGPAVEYAVSFQGAMVSRRIALSRTDSRNNWEIVRRCEIDPTVAASVGSLARSSDSLWWYTDTDWCVRVVDEAARLESQMVRAQWTAVGFNGIHKAILKMLIVRSEESERLLDKLRAANLPIECSTSQPGYIEIVSAKTGTDKGASLVRMLSRDGDSFPYTVAVGDGRNDLGMFSKADLAVTFDDVAEDVRSAADIVLCADRRLALKQLNELLNGGVR